MSAGNSTLYSGLALALLTTAVFAPACANDFNALDDPLYVTENPHVLGGLTASNVVWAFTTTRAANWHPLTWLSLQLDASVFGDRAWGFHLTSVMLHAANAALVFSVLQRYTARAWPSAIAAALFALHPLRVESVAWIAERKDVLSTLFGLLALLAYHRYVAAPCRARYALMVVAFCLSLLAKPMWVTLPCVLLLLDFWPLYRLHVPLSCAELKPLIAEKLPLSAIALASCLVTYYAQHAGGAVASFERHSLLTRLDNAATAYVVYLGKTVWPCNLAPFYPHPEKVAGPWQAFAALALLFSLTVITVRQASNRPYLLMGWLWYLGTLVPVIGLVQVGDQALADRYTYLPLLGPTWALVWLLADWNLARPYWIWGTATVLALSMLTALTERQVRLWRDTETLWNHTLRVTEENWVAHTILGVHLLAKERREEARAHFEAAERKQPAKPLILNGLGSYWMRSDLERAQSYFRRSLAAQPGNVNALQGLGVVYHKWGMRGEAEQCLRDALRMDPHDVESLVSLGVVLEDRGRFEEAMQNYQAALRLKPSTGSAHVNLGALLAKQGRSDESAGHYREALRCEPDNAEIQTSAGWLLDSQGKREEALAALRRAVQLDPVLARAQFNLGTVYGKQGNFPSAIRHLGAALRINPKYSQAQFNLGRALNAAGQVEEAVKACGRAVELEPGMLLYRQGFADVLRQAGRNDEALAQETEVRKLTAALSKQQRGRNE